MEWFSVKQGIKLYSATTLRWRMVTIEQLIDEIIITVSTVASQPKDFRQHHSITTSVGVYENI